jgi:4'-phosphopantetheinyl transferase
MELIKSDMISFETGSVIISYIDIEDFSESEFQRAQKDVPGIVRDQAELEEVWRRKLLGRWLIMKTMEMYGIDTNLFKTLAFTDWGKPYFRGIPLFFNIAHSYNVISGAMTFQGEIGIDIEKYRVINIDEFQNDLTVSEWKTISSSPEASKSMLELWTKKESLLKADGRGLQIPLRNVVLRENTAWISGEQKKWKLIKVNIEGFAAHVCVAFQ